MGFRLTLRGGREHLRLGPEHDVLWSLDVSGRLVNAETPGMRQKSAEHPRLGRTPGEEVTWGGGRNVSGNNVRKHCFFA